MGIFSSRRPRCYLLYAIAPEDTPTIDVSLTLGEICADPELPLTIYHDHFLEHPGGLVIFFAETDEEHTTFQSGLEGYLQDWEYALHPLIFSYSPAAFDQQIAFTTGAYSNSDWDTPRHDKLWSYNKPHA